MYSQMFLPALKQTIQINNNKPENNKLMSVLAESMLSYEGTVTSDISVGVLIAIS